MLYNAESGDFQIVVTGDSIITRSMSAFQEPRFLKVVDLLHGGDVTVTNAEMLFHNYEDPPTARPGGTYMRADPRLIKELRYLGVDMVACANNHAYDFGENGILTNIRYLDQYEMPHAGTGRNLSEARSPTYLDTARGRVALISVTSSGPQGMRAGEQWRDGAGRPGANLLRYTTRYTVDRPVFDALRRMSQGLGLEELKAHRGSNPWQGQFDQDTDTQFFLPNLNNEYQYPEPNGCTFVVGETFETRHVADQEDLEGNLQRVRDARRQADWVIVSVHTHENGKTGDDPSDLIVDFAHACVDAGADVVSGHGPHVDRGIEVYKGKPIFYSLAHLTLQNDTVAWMPWENMQRVSLGWEATPADFFDARSGREHLDEWRDFAVQPFRWRNAVATVTFEARQLREIRLYPIDLGFKRPRSQRGRPVLAQGEVAHEVLDLFRRLSLPFGTDLDIRDEVGVIQVR